MTDVKNSTVSTQTGPNAGDGDGANTSVALAPHHLAMLAEGSGIDLKTIQARGYRSLESGDDDVLASLGYLDHQIRFPGLLIPCYAPGSTEPTHWTYRPDSPLDPKRKYEVPKGQKKRLDVHPRVQHLIADPTVELWVAEGVKKGDSAVSHGLVTVAVDSVWGWRGTNHQGGKTALPDWEDIALANRMITLAFDSDVWRPDRLDLRKSVERLTAFLESKGATVMWCKLPEMEDA